MTAEPEALEFDVDDPFYQACYIFQAPGADDDAESERPRKKRKVVVEDDQEAQALPWPRLCNGEESEALARSRQASFESLWAQKEPKLRAIAEEVDQISLEKIAEYLEEEDTGSKKLRTAIVVSGTNSNSLKYVFSQRRETASGTLHCEIQATQASNLQSALKALIKNAVVSHAGDKAYASHLAAYKRSIPMAFDLELLQEYVSKHGFEKVILSIPDAETFDLNVLSELLSNLTSWKDRIPFVVVLSLATTVNLFESRMSKATISLLEARAFSLTSTKDKYFEIFSAAQLGDQGDGEDDSQPQLLLGPPVVKILYDLSQDQSLTPYAFTRAIKYCYMTHFFANSLSVLVDGIDSDADATALCEAVRNTSSFQKHCTAILDGQVPQLASAAVRDLLDSDTHLLNYTQERLHDSYTTPLQPQIGLHLLAQVCHHLNPTTTPFKHYITLLQDYECNNLHDSAAHDLITTTIPTLPPDSLATLLTTIHPLVTLTHNAPFKALLTSASPPNPAFLVTALTTLLETLRPPTTPPFLSEAIVITRTQLSTNFLPLPRFAISRALTSPGDYLGCECCGTSSTNNSKGRGEPTAVLYRMLEEAGREVNVMDLWGMFRDNILSSGNGMHATASKKGTAKGKASKATPKAKASSKGKGKTIINGTTTEDDDNEVNGSEDTEEQAERKTLTLFYTALAELKYLGLVKSTSDRRLNQGVEVLSKVNWHGL